MPHGTIRSYAERSGSQFSAKPCIVTPRLTRMPIAATLRAPSGVQTPLRPSTRPVASPSASHTSMSSCSTSRT